MTLKICTGTTSMISQDPSCCDLRLLAVICVVAANGEREMAMAAVWQIISCEVLLVLHGRAMREMPQAALQLDSRRSGTAMWPGIQIGLHVNTRSMRRLFEATALERMCRLRRTA